MMQCCTSSILYSLCQWSGLKATVEVYNLFAGEVQQEGLNRAQGTGALQALVPDQTNRHGRRMRGRERKLWRNVRRYQSLGRHHSQQPGAGGRANPGRRGRMRGEEPERSIAVSAIRRRLGVMAVRCQSSSLLERLETLGPGGAAAAGRRWQASDSSICSVLTLFEL